MFRLPFTFIITGMISFVLFHFLTFADFAGWVHSEPRSPDGWFHIHLLVLGWATMMAMGAVYQLINVVLQTELHSKRLGYIHYGLFATGTLGLLAGFDHFNAKWIAAFATLAFAGILLFAWNIGATLLKAKQWNPITISTACAIIYLCLAALTGMLMGMDFKFNFLGIYHMKLLGAHIWLGTIGWFGLLVTGFSYKLLPMFYLAHQYPVSLQKWVLVFWNAAVWLGCYGFLSSKVIFNAAAFIVLIVALSLYNVHIGQIMKHKHKKSAGAGIEWTAWSARMLLALVIMGTAAVLYNAELAHQTSFIVFMLWSYLYGWVAVTIMGYLSKIVPFLWWTYKYGPKAGKAKVPTMAQLLPERPVHIGLSSVVLCMGGLLAGLGTNNSVMIMISGMALSVAAVIYMIRIGYVFTR
ncbi:hypothetical protein SAMN05661091_5189 [Paenibacillus uliginis N3/975]|uniref:Cytochrome C and Quinol oxidase polypeptide I n=1 Tax=Paenibacillus uliginis N3/975 TaxID=1313296 RepID=A0A1X7HQW7_9BACL|nr:hypothetical protein [Paenibacillus uliginis]SMF90693.1 hypothetical protein SAMN05661091_5189 [Paenibacillus uliginis N3/975]